MLSSVSLLISALPVVSFAKRQMYLTRHCVRTSDDDSLIANYTQHSMPNWGAPNGWCTAGGMEIMSKTGKDLVDSFGFEPESVRFFSDPIMRDEDTAFQMMQGMGIKHAAVDLDEGLFNPVQCLNGDGAPTDEQIAAERRARFNVLPLPGDYKIALAELQDILGVGPAGRLEDIDGPDAGPVLDDHGVPTGAALVMAEFGQVMLYAYASDIPFLNVTAEQRNKFTAWKAWATNIFFYDNSFMPVYNTYLLHRILDDLKTASTTNVFAAHDANLDGIASILGLKWNASPYAPSETNGELTPTPPGSGLLFEFDDENNGAVTVTFVYRVFDHADVFRLSRSEVAHYGSMTEFEQAIMSGLRNFIGAEKCFSSYKQTAFPVLV